MTRLETPPVVALSKINYLKSAQAAKHKSKLYLLIKQRGIYSHIVELFI